MTRRLILMRHAKSSWDDPLLTDFDRPLNRRGRRSATAMGEWLRENNYIPDQILSSSSERTRETCARLKMTCETRFFDGLYHASAGQMLTVLQQASGGTVLMLGHNPGIAWFAQQIVEFPPKHPRFSDYPTCATLVVDVPIEDWAMLRPGTGTPVNFVIPRELTEP